MDCRFLSTFVLATLLVGFDAWADTLDLSDPEDALLASRKVQCSLEDGVPTILSWSGRVYSHVSGVADTHLFDTEAFSVRQCKTYRDTTRGLGYRIVAREVILFLDPTTGNILRSWDNPWTGESLEVMHVANDPMAPPFPFYAMSADGEAHEFEGTVMGDLVSVTNEKILFYESPLGGDFQPFVGGHYHAYEVFQFFVPTDELLDRTISDVSTLSMSNARFGPWMPWMKMGGRPGHLIFQGAGRKLGSFEELPALLKTEVRTNYSAFENPPSLDDTRPMANSLVRFKTEMEARQADQSNPTLNPR